MGGKGVSRWGGKGVGSRDGRGSAGREGRGQWMGRKGPAERAARPQERSSPSTSAVMGEDAPAPGTTGAKTPKQDKQEGCNQEMIDPWG